MHLKCLNVIEHRLTKVSHLWKKGQVERMNKTLKNNPENGWKDVIEFFLTDNHIENIDIAAADEDGKKLQWVWELLLERKLLLQIFSKTYFKNLPSCITLYNLFVRIMILSM